MESGKVTSYKTTAVCIDSENENKICMWAVLEFKYVDVYVEGKKAAGFRAANISHTEDQCDIGLVTDAVIQFEKVTQLLTAMDWF